MKKITFPYKGKEYTLEFNRRSIEKMEANGFDINTAPNTPVTTIRVLFEGAFLMHHPYVDKRVIAEIYDEFTNKQDLLNALIEMYSEPIQALSEDSKSKNAIRWDKNF